MGFAKIKDEELVGRGVVGLPDRPSLSTLDMQKKFDELAMDVIIPKFNQLSEEIESSILDTIAEVKANEEEKKIAGALALKAYMKYVIENFLPLTGGTLTGNLSTNGSISAKNGMGLAGGYGTIVADSCRIRIGITPTSDAAVEKDPENVYQNHIYLILSNEEVMGEEGLLYIRDDIGSRYNVFTEYNLDLLRRYVLDINGGTLYGDLFRNVNGKKCNFFGEHNKPTGVISGLSTSNYIGGTGGALLLWNEDFAYYDDAYIITGSGCYALSSPNFLGTTYMICFYNGYLYIDEMYYDEFNTLVTEHFDYRYLVL